MARSIRPGSIVQYVGSMSTNTGFARAYSIAATVATNVNGTVMTSSPGPTPAASRDRCSALVPLLTPIASAVWQKAAKLFSNDDTAGPRMNCASSRTR